MVDKSVNKAFLMPEQKGGFSVFNEVLVAPTDKSVLLWRYLDLARLIALLSDKKLYFARADAFQDTHEGAITARMAQALEAQFSDRVPLRLKLSEFRKQLKECMFISCWCMGTSESEAMWRLCGENEKYGVAIVVAYKDIEATFTGTGFVMAPVNYLDYRSQGFPQDSFYYPFFHKRREYEHEKEVRIVKWCGDQGIIGKLVNATKEEAEKEYQQKLARAKVLKEERGMGISLEFDVDNLVRTIVVHPNAPEWYYNIIKKVVQKFAPPLTEKVQWSFMRMEPLY